MKNIKKSKRIFLKVSPKEDLTQKIEIATQTLERNIGFINSCDSKTSIVLTAIGVLLTIILTNDGLTAIFKIVARSASGKTFCDILYLVGLAASVCMLISGIWKLVSVLIAKTEPLPKNQKTNVASSMIFFGGILKVGDSAAYRNKFLAMTKEELLDDLIAEIYINAEIATQKYKRYNWGLKLTVCGFVLFILMFLAGMYVYG